MSWAVLNPDQFGRLVEAELRWLAVEFGYVVSQNRQIGMRYAEIVLTNATSHVRVGWEPQESGYLPVDVGKRATSMAVERHVPDGRYPLWIFAFTAGATEAAWSAIKELRGESKREVKAALGVASDALSQYARPVLGGDFSSFNAVETDYNSYVSRNPTRFGYEIVDR